MAFRSIAAVIIAAGLISASLATDNSSCISNNAAVANNADLSPCEIAASIVLDENLATSQPERTFSVSLRMQIITIDSVDPVAETVNVGFNLEMSWIDSRIRYDTKTDCKMPIMIDKISSIWYPAFFISNAANDLDYGSLKERSAIVDQTGRVTWPVFLYTSVTCKMDITYFPFDIQACNIGIANTLVFNSVYVKGYLARTHDQTGNFSVDFVGTPPLSTDAARNALKFNEDATTLSLWDVTGACTYSKPEEITGNLYFLFRLQRKSSYYVVTLTIPTFVVSCLMATTFTADQADEEKLSIAITGLLSYFFLLSTISTQIPASSDTTPSLLYFYSFLLISGALVTFIAAVVRNIAAKAEAEESKYHERLARIFNILSLCIYSVVTIVVYAFFFTWLRVNQSVQQSTSLGAFDEQVCNPTDPEIVSDA